MIKNTKQKQLGKERVCFSLQVTVHYPLLGKNKQEWNTKQNLEVETTEWQCLLVCFQWLGQTDFFISYTAHSMLHTHATHKHWGGGKNQTHEKNKSFSKY